jgi:glucokinase
MAKEIFGIGVDVGATNVRAGKVNLNTGEIVGELKKKTIYDEVHRQLINDLKSGKALGTKYGTNSRSIPAGVMKKLREHSLGNLFSCIGELMNDGPKESVVGIGLGSPGPLNPVDGIVGQKEADVPPNLYGWDHVLLTKTVSDHFGVPSKLNGDVRVMANGELFFGAGKGTNTFLMIAPGTGFGAGVVIDGRVQDGKYHTAGEIWKSPVIRNPLFGYKILDYYGSADGIARIYRENLFLNKKFTKITRKDELEIDRIISGKHGFKAEFNAKNVAAAAKDPKHPAHKFAVKAVDEYGAFLGLCLSSHLSTMNAERLVVGGTGAKDLPLYRKALQNALDSNMTYVTEVIAARLGDEAGIIGSACLFK